MKSYLDSLFSLEGKTAIITGSSRGIGAEIAKGYINAGANVICIARSKIPENKILNKQYIQCDITNSSAFDQICIEAIRNHGRLDILVNAAGVTQSVEKLKNTTSFLEILNINLVASYNCIKTISKYMNHGGSIINITSIASFQGFPDNPAYVASKGGLRMLTKALAIDLSKKNIRVNNLAPGYINTKMTEESYQNPKKNKERLSRMIINRWGRPEDIIGAAIFLASNASGYVTGSDILVDGGWVARGL